MEQLSLFASPEERRSALRHLMLTDHGFLRAVWTHEFEIAPGVWRSNQPSPRRIESWAARGIRSVLFLRGKDARDGINRLEREACAKHELAFHHVPVAGAVMMAPESLLTLLDCFKSAEKPFVMHCKSGIDRTGFAAFLYLMAETDTRPEIARRQLSFKYLHLNGKRHGILDFMADAFLAANAASGIGLRDWIETEYDPERLTAAYRSGAVPT